MQIAAEDGRVVVVAADDATADDEKNVRTSENRSNTFTERLIARDG